MKKILISFLFSAFLAQPAYAGFALGQTRVVYNEAEKQASLRVINSGTDEYYLVQAWVEDKNNKPSDNFIVTPPVFKFTPQSQNTLMIKTISGMPAADRETLYYVNVKAIPAVDNTIKNKISFATKSVIKLIYRPAGLKSTEALNAWRKLNISKTSDAIVINNPTPYIVNFGFFYVDGQVKEVSYVLPFSEQRIELKNASQAKMVKYNTINDFGGPSDYLTLNI